MYNLARHIFFIFILFIVLVVRFMSLYHSVSSQSTSSACYQGYSPNIHALSFTHTHTLDIPLPQTFNNIKNMSSLYIQCEIADNVSTAFHCKHRIQQIGHLTNRREEK